MVRVLLEEAAPSDLDLQSETSVTGYVLLMAGCVVDGAHSYGNPSPVSEIAFLWQPVRCLGKFTAVSWLLFVPWFLHRAFVGWQKPTRLKKKKVYDIFLVKKMLYSLGIYVSWSSGVSRSERMTDGTTFAETNCPGLPLFFFFFFKSCETKDHYSLCRGQCCRDSLSRFFLSFFLFRSVCF